MKLNDFYSSNVLFTSLNLYSLEKHLDVYIDLSSIPYDYNDDSLNQQRVVLKYHLSDNYDSRRGMDIFSVWFDEKPVMLCLQAGRELRDDIKTFISVKETYSKMIQYIQSLIQNDIDITTFDSNENLAELERFYGYELFEYFDFGSFELYYKEGDQILLETLEIEGNIFKNVKAIIKQVRPKSFYKAYDIQLVDYKLYPNEATRDFKIVPKEEQYNFYKEKEVPDYEVILNCSIKDAEDFKLIK